MYGIPLVSKYIYSWKQVRLSMNLLNNYIQKLFYICCSVWLSKYSRKDYCQFDYFGMFENVSRIETFPNCFYILPVLKLFTNTRFETGPNLVNTKYQNLRKTAFLFFSCFESITDFRFETDQNQVSCIQYQVSRFQYRLNCFQQQISRFWYQVSCFQC